MIYKITRIAEEYDKLLTVNPKLHKLIDILDCFAQMELGKELTVTCIFRTKEENDALYAATPPSQRPPTSPHCFFHAVDLRSSDFTDLQINRIVAFANQFTYEGGARKVALYHEISGNVKHLHIQYF